MAWRDQRNTLSDHLRDYMDDEFVHLPGIKEGGNKLTAAHTSQMCLPFSMRNRSAKMGTSSQMTVTLGLAAFDSVRENT
jgi:hypothetical protein